MSPASPGRTRRPPDRRPPAVRHRSSRRRRRRRPDDPAAAEVLRTPTVLEELEILDEIAPMRQRRHD